MAFIEERRVRANGVDFFVAEAGDRRAPLLLCLHGFPECWASWRFQLPLLAESGYHAVAIDLRGYGFSEGPAGVDDCRLSVLRADVLALLAALGKERAVLLGHGLGADIAWQLACYHPQQVVALVALSHPWGGVSKLAPSEEIARLFGDRFFYMRYFQQPQLPEQELEADVDDSLRRLFHGLCAEGQAQIAIDPQQTRLLSGLPRPQSQPRWMREEDLAYYVARFQQRGFSGALNGYRAMDLSWQEAQADGIGPVSVPALFIGGLQDPVLQYYQPAMMRMSDWVADLSTVLLDQCGHWPHLEQAAEVNRELLSFLQALPGEKQAAS